MKMVHWRGIAPWMMRAWPFLALLPIVGTHWLAVYYVPHPVGQIHKIVGTILQVVGGVLVLYSLNENLGLFRSQSLAGVFLSWVKSFPLVRHATASGNIFLTGLIASGGATASARLASTTLEERVAALEVQINEVRVRYDAEVSELHKKISSA